MLISSRQRWISFTSQSLLRIGAFQKCKSDTSTEETQPPKEQPVSDEAKEPDKEEPITEPKIVVFGGNGFVGTRVCEAAHEMGLNVISINRSGKPSWLNEPWSRDVEWVYGDALQPACYVDQLRGALGAVSCVGAFGSNTHMYRICGEANIKVMETAASVNVPRFVFVSAYHNTLPGLIKRIGYFRGKIAAEDALRRLYGPNGIALRPFFIHGTRQITEALGIPLQAVGIPMEKAIGLIPNSKSLATSIPLFGTGLVPPVRVESVAKAAVMAVTDPQISQPYLDPWEISKY